MVKIANGEQKELMLSPALSSLLDGEYKVSLHLGQSKDNIGANILSSFRGHRLSNEFGPMFMHTTYKIPAINV